MSMACLRLPTCYATRDGMQDCAILQWTPSIAPKRNGVFYRRPAAAQWEDDLFVGALAGQHLPPLDIEGGRIIKQERLLTDAGSPHTRCTQCAGWIFRRHH